MKQTRLYIDLYIKKTCKQVFQERMEHVIHWAVLVMAIAAHYFEGRTDRPPFSPATMLRFHFMQQWFMLSDPSIDEALFDMQMYREFAHLDKFGHLCGESTILCLRISLEKPKLAKNNLSVVKKILIQHGLLLKTGVVVDAPLFVVSSSTNSKEHKHVPKIHISKTDQLMFFGKTALLGLKVHPSDERINATLKDFA